MTPQYVYVVVDRNNATLVTRVERNEALRNLAHYRSLGTKCALVQETTTDHGSTERTVIDYDATCNFPGITC